jgi:hypothetical protein
MTRHATDQRPGVALCSGFWNLRASLVETRPRGLWSS